MGTSAETTVYAGSLEIVTDATGTHNRYNLSAYGKAVAIVDLEEPTPGSPTITDQYLLTDNLGSVDVATTSTGAVVGSTGFSFDAFGKRRDSGTWQMPANGAAVTADRTTVTHRGFTGHEMLDGVGIVDMNGRIYLPTLGRFASVDPVFQFPTNTQSLNPYSYVLNNPLSLTDPTGYADKCPAGQTCGGAAPKQQQTQKSQGYGGHGGESSRIAEGKQSGAGMQFSKAVRAVGELAHQATGALGEALTGLYKGLVQNGAKFLQGINDAQNKPTTAANINSSSSVGVTDMHLSAAGQDELKILEAIGGVPVLTAYPDQAGNTTIGWGHKETTGEKLTKITKDKAQSLFNNDVSSAENSVKAAIKMRVSQNQFDALVMVAFNASTSNLGAVAPHMVHDINTGDFAGAASEFNFNSYHDKYGIKHPSDGLAARSSTERNWFINGPHP